MIEILLMVLKGICIFIGFLGILMGVVFYGWLYLNIYREMKIIITNFKKKKKGK